MIMLDVDPLFAEMRGVANIKLNRMLQDMETCGARTGTMTIKVKVDRKEMVVPDTDTKARVAVTPVFSWKVSNSIPVKSEMKNTIYADNMELVAGEDGCIRMERIRVGQMSMEDYEDYGDGFTG